MYRSLFLDAQTVEKAVQFIQAEKMFYETSLINISGLQKKIGKYKVTTYNNEFADIKVFINLLLTLNDMKQKQFSREYNSLYLTQMKLFKFLD